MVVEKGSDQIMTSTMSPVIGFEHANDERWPLVGLPAEYNSHRQVRLNYPNWRIGGDFMHRMSFATARHPIAGTTQANGE